MKTLLILMDEQILTIEGVNETRTTTVLADYFKWARTYRE